MGLDLTDIGQGDVEKEWNKIWVEQKIVFFFFTRWTMSNKILTLQNYRLRIIWDSEMIVKQDHRVLQEMW